MTNRESDIRVREIFTAIGILLVADYLLRLKKDTSSELRPPFNAEYTLYFLLPKEDRETLIGDLVECHGQLLLRFGKRRADIWFYKQVAGSLLPLLRRALFRIVALVWLGRVLRRLIS